MRSPGERLSQSNQRINIAVIELKSRREVSSRLPYAIQRERLVHDCPAPHREVDRIHVVWTLPLCSPGLRRYQFDANRPGQPGGDFILHIEEVGTRLVEPLGPEMGSGIGVDKLRVDADAAATTLHAAFHDIAHAQFAPNL